ncbi:YraN family protein [Granulicoccus sp. GXG6511]|uniref:YraN family protein n=1 Tax=Granulicoccus sp. GXG6511 TaxID=3381351 RepID=UPI003D7E3498
MTGVKQRLGAQGEEWAEEVLSEAGMFVIDRNWRCREGEIDLIAVDEVDGETILVFCEVKYRTGTGFGTPLEGITYEKVRRLRRAAAMWLRERKVSTRRIRLDAIGILAVRGRDIEVTHVRGIE